MDITRDELGDIIAAAAKRGAEEALAELGFGDEKAPEHVRELRTIAGMMIKIREGVAKGIGTAVVWVFLAGLLVLAGANTDTIKVWLKGHP